MEHYHVLPRPNINISEYGETKQYEEELYKSGHSKEA